MARSRKPSGTRNVFTQNQVSQLRRLLDSDDADSTLVKLGAALTRYHHFDRDAATDRDSYRETAKAQKAAARKIESRAEQLLTALRQASPLMSEAVDRKYVRRGSPGPVINWMADLARSPDVGLPEINGNPWSFDGTQAVLEALVGHVGDWKERAHIESLAPKGRKVGIRRIFAEWVALELEEVGVPLKKSPDGRFGRILTILYDAGNIDAPTDVYQDVAYVLDKIRRHRKLLH